MTQRDKAMAAARRFVTDPSDENARDLRPHLADDVAFAVHTINENEADKGIAGFQDSLFGNVVFGSEWEEPETDGDTTTQLLRMPPQAIAAACRFRFTTSPSGQLVTIDGEWVLPPAALEPGPIRMTKAMRARIDNAETDRMPIVFAYQATNGEPNQIYRSTAHAHTDNTLAFWNSLDDDGFIEALANNPTVSAMYRHAETHEMLEMSGQARVVQDAGEKRAIRRARPDAAEAVDPEGNGVAIVIELDRVNGLIHAAETGAIERISMARPNVA